MKRAFALAFLAACTRTGAPSVTPPAQTGLSAALEPIREKGHVPALAAAAWRGDELLAIGATGFRKGDSGARASLDDPWHLGSDTKAMTAVLVAIYVDRGKLRFEDTLGAIFGSGVHPKLAAVTIEQLLQHRGGLPHQFPPDIWARMWRDDADARTEGVRAVLAREPSQPVGTFEYANPGYVTLGAALERVTGKKWEALMRDDLFAPLGMTTCGFGAPTGDVPWGHEADGSPVEPGPKADNPLSNAPAGGVYCSLRDWGKFLGVVLKGLRGEPTIARVETMKRLLEPPNEGERYAGGWSFVARGWAGDGPAVTHTGSNTLWTATAWLAPAKNLAFVAVSNRHDPKTVDAAFSTTIPVYAK